MTFTEVLKVAWEGLLANKIRSLLTMLGVIIGVAAVIIMIAISAGTEATIAEQINSLGANLIFVSRVGFGRPGSEGGGSQGLVYSDAQALASQVPGVAGVVVEQPAAQTVKVGNSTLTEVEILGTTPDFPSVRAVSLAQGRFFNDREVERKAKVAVLGHSLAQELFGQDDPIGQSIAVGNTKLAIIGVMAEKGVVGNTDFDARLYTPITVVFDKFLPSQFARFAGDRVRVIYVEASDREQMDSTILQVGLLLARRHEVPADQPDFNIQTQQDIIDTQESTTEAFRNLLAWVAGVSLVVGGIGIMNIMLVSVTERTREIGIRQAVGATPADVRWQFLTEALVLSLVGGLIGVVLGVGGAWVFGATAGMRTVVVPGSILLAFGSAAAVGIFFGFFPANKAAQLDPIVALRHE